PPLFHPLPPGFAPRPAWTAQVAPDTASPDRAIVGGPLVVTGDTVVVPNVEAAQVNGSRVSLQFRDAATGRLRRSQPLPVGTFDGAAEGRAAGQPVAVVRHTSTADAQAGSVKQTTVYGADGSVVWDSAGRARTATDEDG